MSGPHNDIHKSKKERIIQAALIEFSEKLFDEASTNVITKAANVSKGTLFYYFSSKETLYLELVKRGTVYIEPYYLDQSYIKEPDFIERYRQLSELKRSAMQKEPGLFNFMAMLYLHPPTCVPKETMARMYKQIEMMRKRLYDHVDTQLFRFDFEPKRVMDMITWCMEGYEYKLIQELKGMPLTEYDVEQAYRDYDVFLKQLKTIYYT